MPSAKDLREFRGFLRNATDRQVQGIYDKEKRAGRDQYAELASAEAERRGIKLDDGRYHSTKKKKSRGQLDREIAAALRGSTRTAHATKRAIPGVAKWSMTAGGTGSAEGKHGYTFTVPEGTYHIWPFTTKLGRHAGYSVKFSATGGRPRGSHGGLWHDLGTHRSPAAAAGAAAKHHAGGFE